MEKMDKEEDLDNIQDEQPQVRKFVMSIKQDADITSPLKTNEAVSSTTSIDIKNKSGDNVILEKVYTDDYIADILFLLKYRYDDVMSRLLRNHDVTKNLVTKWQRTHSERADNVCRTLMRDHSRSFTDCTDDDGLPFEKSWEAFEKIGMDNLFTALLNEKDPTKITRTLKDSRELFPEAKRAARRKQERIESEEHSEKDNLYNTLFKRKPNETRDSEF